MQSVNGDVQLSVTLDTKGIQSDAQKIKKEIERELSITNNSPEIKVDSKSIESAEKDIKALTSEAKNLGTELNKSLENTQDLSSVDIYLDVDESGIDNVQNKLQDATSDAQQISDYLSGMSGGIEVDASGMEDAAESISSATKDFSVASETISSAMKDFPSNVAEFSKATANFSSSVQSMSGEPSFAQSIDGIQETVDAERELSGTLDDQTVTLEDLKKRWEEVLAKQDRFNTLTTDQESIRLNDAIVEQQLNNIQNQVSMLTDEEQDVFDSWVDDFMSARIAQQELLNAQQQMNDGQKQIVVDTEAYREALNGAKITAQQLAQDLQAFQGGMMYSEEFKGVKEDADILSKKLESINKKLREMELLEQTDSDKYKQMAEEAQAISENLKEANSEMSRMRNTGEAYTLGSNPQEMAQVQKQYDAVTDKMALMGKRMTDVNKLTSMLPGKLGASVRKITNATQGIQRLSQLSFKEVSENLSALGSELSTFATGSLSTAGAVASSVGIIVGAIVIRVTQAIKQAKEGLAQLAKILKKGLQVSLQKLSGFAKILAGSFVKLGKTLNGTLIQGIRKLISKLMSLKGAIKENLDEMAKLHNDNNAVNKALSNLTSSLNYLKGALATAFVPILTTVEPMLTSLIDKLAEATTMVGILIAKMTGATSFQKAVRKQKDYADSLKKVGGAASDASKQLADYDKLQVVQSNKSGGAGVDFEEISIEAVDISKIFDDLSDKASKLGTDLGTKLRDSLNSIPWDEIKEKAKQLASAIASFINSLIEVPGLAQAIGKTLGEAINTIVGALRTFFTETHWDELGQFIGTALQTAIETVEWDELGKLFADMINATFDFVKGFTETFNGEEFGKKLTEMITNALDNIEWEDVKLAVQGLVDDLVGILNGLITPETFISIGKTLGKSVATIFEAIQTAADDAEWETWGRSIGLGIMVMLNNIKWDEAGQAISDFADGLLTMIETAIDTMNADKIADHLVEFLENIKWEELAGKAVEISKKLSEGLKKVFEQLRDSDAYDEIIQAVVDFLNEKENWERLFKSFKNKVIRDVVVEQVWGQTKELFKLSGEQFADIEDALTSGGSWLQIGSRIGFDIISGIASAILGGLDIIAEPLKELATNLYKALRDALGITGTADGSVESEEIGRQIIEGFFTGRGLYAFGEKIGKWFTEEVAPWFTVERWSGIIENVQIALATKWTEIKGFLSMIKATLMNRLAVFKSGVLNIFVGLAGAIKTPLNTMIAAIESFVNYLIKGINSAIDTLNSLEFDVPDWVPEIGGKSMGLNIPSVSKITLPRLAQGAVIPPNKEFMAVLGDQKSGTNIETPLKTMMDAFRQVLSETGGVGGNNNQPIVLQLNGRVLAQAVWDEERKKYRQTSSYSY